MTLPELLDYQIKKYTILLAIASTDGARSFAGAEVYRLKRKLIEIEEIEKLDLNELELTIYQPVETVKIKP